MFSSSDRLQSFSGLIRDLEENGIETEYSFLPGEICIEGEQPGTLYITDCEGAAKACVEQNAAILGYSHADNRQDSFEGVKYLLEQPEEIEIQYLEKVYRRFAGLSWSILETEHCFVRESCLEDVDVFYKIYSEPAVKRYIEPLYEEPLQEREYLQAYINNVYDYYEFGIWTVIDKASGEIMGRAGIDLQEDDEIPQLGYIFATKWHGTGVAEEVCRAILKYAKKEWGLGQIQVSIHPENVASIKLAQKLGFHLVKEMDGSKIQGGLV